MKALIAAVGMLVIAACGAYQFPGGASSGSSGNVHGTVLSVPCAPVEQAGSPCAGRAVAGVTITYVAGSEVAGHAVTDSAGRYSVDLPPGTYTVKFDTYMRLVSGPPTVKLAGHGSIEADYILDNGIRAPQPVPATSSSASS
jgi:hypothetical protein